MSELLAEGREAVRGNRLRMELPEMGRKALDNSQMLSRGWMPERNNEAR